MALRVVDDPPLRLVPVAERSAGTILKLIIGIVVGVALGFGVEVFLGVEVGRSEEVGRGVEVFLGGEVGRGVEVGRVVEVGRGVEVTARAGLRREKYKRTKQQNVFFIVKWILPQRRELRAEVLINTL